MNAKEKPGLGRDPSSGLNKQKINYQQDTTLDQFHQLLLHAGHRPTKEGKWVCANCPPQKPPAMSVGSEVYFCHRCGTGGSLITLKKNLGLLSGHQWTKAERRLHALRQERIERELQNFLSWLNSLRREYILMFRSAFDVETIGLSLGRAMLAKGIPVDSNILQVAFDAATDGETFSAFLDYLDARENRPKIFEIWRARNAA